MRFLNASVKKRRGWRRNYHNPKRDRGIFFKNSDPSLTLFEVALIVRFRAKGPAICLAQPNGLGVNKKECRRANGPAI